MESAEQRQATTTVRTGQRVRRRALETSLLAVEAAVTAGNRAEARAVFLAAAEVVENPTPAGPERVLPVALVEQPEAGRAALLALVLRHRRIQEEVEVAVAVLPPEPLAERPLSWAEWAVAEVVLASMVSHCSQVRTER